MSSSPAIPRLDDRSWAVWPDAETGAFVIWLSGHVTTATAIDAVRRLIDLLVEREVPAFVVADLLDVVSFDADAPVASARIAMPVAHLVNHLEIICTRQTVRIAAVSAARLLGLHVSVRTER
jgi:hypothetical protein